MPQAAILDMFFQRYSWDLEVYQRQPEALIEELIKVISAEGDAMSATRSPGDHFVHPDRTQAELLQEASSAGMPVHPSMMRN